MALALSCTFAFGSAPGVERVSDVLATGIPVAGSLAGALCGFLLVVPFRYPSVWRAMAVGAVTAVVAHVPFSMAFAVLDGWMAGALPDTASVIRGFAYTLLHGFEIVLLPSILSGGVAGAACYGLSRHRPNTPE